MIRLVATIFILLGAATIGCGRDRSLVDAGPGPIYCAVPIHQTCDARKDAP